MKLQLLQVLFALARQAVVIGASDSFAVRRRGTEFNLAPIRDHSTLYEDAEQGLRSRQNSACGDDSGSCPLGQCCSESGHCGTSSEYCAGPQCQIEYSNGACDARSVFPGLWACHSHILRKICSLTISTICIQPETCW